MKKINKELDTTKRDFIKKSALAGAGVVATTMVGGEALAAISVEDAVVTKDKGYELTPHIAAYYESVDI